MAQYLLEVYLARSDAQGVAPSRSGAPADPLAGQGAGISLLRAIYIPEDETCFYLYEADSADVVRESAKRAEIAGRVVTAITQVKGAKP